MARPLLRENGEFCTVPATAPTASPSGAASRSDGSTSVAMAEPGEESALYTTRVSRLSTNVEPSTLRTDALTKRAPPTWSEELFENVTLRTVRFDSPMTQTPPPVALLSATSAGLAAWA